MKLQATPIDLARLAAFLDGEGCIRLGERKAPKDRIVGYLYIHVSLANTDIRLMHWLKDTFGGNVCVDSRSIDHKTHCLLYKWTIETKAAYAVLKACLPYFICKKDQAEIAVAFQETTINKTGLKTPIHILERQMKMKEDITFLKTREAKDLVALEMPLIH